MTSDFIQNIEFDSFSVDLGLEVDIATLAAAGAYTDEKFSEVPEQIQSDLAQTDENAVDFVKNKKTSNLENDSLVESVTSTDNHIVVDNADAQNPVVSFQTVDNENFVTDDEKADIATIPDKANSSDVYTKSETYTQTEINNKLSAVYKFKGTVDYFVDLPIDAENADVWNVRFGVEPIPNGVNYAWVEATTSWDDLGGLVGLATLTENGLLSKEDFAIIQNLANTYAPLVHTHEGEDITPESVTTDQIVLNGFDRDGNAITVTLVYNTDLGVIEFQYPDGTTGQDHLELWFIAKCQGACRNGYGAQFVSSQGGHIVVKEMVASELNTQPQLFMGLFTQTAANGEFIKITWFGSVNDVSTTEYEAEGSAKILYVDMVGSGLRGFTTIAPAAPYRKIMAASIQKYSTGAAENGVILVRPTFGVKLADLDDVDGTDTTIADTDEILKKDTAGLWKKVTWANVKTLLNNIFFSKTESDRRFVNQNGGTIYHITRWFTPTSALTIAANGLSATITSGQFTTAMTGAKLKLTGGVNEPIITYVSSNSINLSFAVDASFFSQSVAVADWGVYSYEQIFESNGNISFYNNTGIRKFNIPTGNSRPYFPQGATINGMVNNADTLFLGDTIDLAGSYLKIRWSNNDGWQGATKDTGLFRSLAGRLKIYNGIDTNERRDLELRSLFADMFKANLATGFTFKNSSDVDVFAIDNNGFQLDQYDDVLPSDAWTPASGGAAPDITTHTIGGMAANYRSFDGNNTEETMVNTFEILHGIDVDALNRATAPLLAEVHTHGMPSTALAGVVKIFYDIVYQPVNAAPIALGTFSNLITINASEQYFHKLGGVEITKPSSGFSIGDQIIVKYRRTPTDAQDTYAGDWLFMQCALHMPFNSNGSRQRYVK